MLGIFCGVLYLRNRFGKRVPEGVLNERGSGVRYLQPSDVRLARIIKISHGIW